MPYSGRIWIKALTPAIAATILAGLTGCLGQTKAPELVSGSETQVVIVADLDNSPKSLAESHCAQHGKRPQLRDTVPAKGNFVIGWATGTKVFMYTFDCQ